MCFDYKSADAKLDDETPLSKGPIDEAKAPLAGNLVQRTTDPSFDPQDTNKLV